MSISTSDLEEYLVRKTIEAGNSSPTIDNLMRIRFILDFDDSVVESYLEEKRDAESQQDYADLLDLIEAIKSEEI